MGDYSSEHPAETPASTASRVVASNETTKNGDTGSAGMAQEAQMDPPEIERLVEEKGDNNGHLHSEKTESEQDAFGNPMISLDPYIRLPKASLLHFLESEAGFSEEESLGLVLELEKIQTPRHRAQRINDVLFKHFSVSGKCEVPMGKMALRRVAIPVRVFSRFDILQAVSQPKFPIPSEIQALVDARNRDLQEEQRPQQKETQQKPVEGQEKHETPNEATTKGQSVSQQGKQSAISFGNQEQRSNLRNQQDLKQRAHGDQAQNRQQHHSSEPQPNEPYKQQTLEQRSSGEKQSSWSKNHGQQQKPGCSQTQGLSSIQHRNQLQAEAKAVPTYSTATHSVANSSHQGQSIPAPETGSEKKENQHPNAGANGVSRLSQKPSVKKRKARVWPSIPVSWREGPFETARHSVEFTKRKGVTAENAITEKGESWCGSAVYSLRVKSGMSSEEPNSSTIQDKVLTGEKKDQDSSNEYVIARFKDSSRGVNECLVIWDNAKKCRLHPPPLPEAWVEFKLKQPLASVDALQIDGDDAPGSLNTNATPKSSTEVSRKTSPNRPKNAAKDAPLETTTWNDELVTPGEFPEKFSEDFSIHSLRLRLTEKTTSEYREEKRRAQRRAARERRRQMKAANALDTWVQCDRCDKWRQIPTEPEEGKEWYCSMIEGKSCEDPEDSYDDEEDDANQVDNGSKEESTKNKSKPVPEVAKKVKTGADTNASDKKKTKDNEVPMNESPAENEESGRYPRRSRTKPTQFNPSPRKTMTDEAKEDPAEATPPQPKRSKVSNKRVDSLKERQQRNEKKDKSLATSKSLTVRIPLATASPKNDAKKRRRSKRISGGSADFEVEKTAKKMKTSVQQGNDGKLTITLQSSHSKRRSARTRRSRG